MNCPRCARSTESRRVGTAHVAGCSRCRGLFLDHGELNRLAGETDGDVEYATLHGETFEHADAYAPIACPRCERRPMGKVEFNIYTGIILDYCGECRGFWLDGHELERINDEVRRLDEASDSTINAPAMLWFARLMWNLPR